jgi:hypothetical protein
MAVEQKEDSVVMEEMAEEEGMPFFQRWFCFDPIAGTLPMKAPSHVRPKERERKSPPACPF